MRRLYAEGMGQINVPLDLSSRLNRRRRELGMSVAELARRTDLSRSLVHALMTGKRSPTPAVAEPLIRVLEIDGELAETLRSIGVSRYESGEMGEVILTKNETEA